VTALRVHEGDGAHEHEMSLDARGRLVEHIWRIENVELTTVGIDIGSSTSHLMLAGVRLQRKTQALSSQFLVVERKVLWKSPILLTPFVADGTIDARALGAFIRDCYREAGIGPEAIDTGAVILTGEAIKRTNARAIADLFAGDAGRFVCASAGHHLECVLAANGSGAVALSRETGQPMLNVDIGGGTTKIALVSGGRVVSTCAFAVGGRLVAFDRDGRIARLDESARIAAQMAGIRLAEGDKPPQGAIEALVDALADAAVAVIRGAPASGLAAELLLTEPLERAVEPQGITFSGGVAEYIYGRETRDYGDIARPLAVRIRDACSSGRIPWPVREPAEGIRATVIGASQFTVQVSGKTIHIGEAVRLPLRNVPVVAPRITLGDDIDAGDVARSIQAAMARASVDDDAPVALALPWDGEPSHRRLRALAEGIALPLVNRHSMPVPLVLMIDGDVGRTLGYILEHEHALDRPIVSIDGIQLREFDYVDIGEVIRPADVVPVVIKSLLFPAPSRPAAKPMSFQPLQPIRSAE
jgi:ethanolamine utilization protein EutA